MNNFDSRNEDKMSGISLCLELLIKIFCIKEEIVEEVIAKGFIQLFSNFILETKVSSKEVYRARMIRITC